MCSCRGARHETGRAPGRSQAGPRPLGGPTDVLIGRGVVMNATWSVALVGNPNCGKTALFNLLTGARQKVANYAGVTVERKVGVARLRNGHALSVIDLPGAYSL